MSMFSENPSEKIDHLRDEELRPLENNLFGKPGPESVTEEDLRGLETHKVKDLGTIRKFFSSSKPWTMMVSGAVLIGIGAVPLLGGAIATGATMGAGAPVAAVFMGLGVAIIATGIGSIALGITKASREIWFDIKADDVERQFINSNDFKEIRKKVKEVRDNYPSVRLKDARMHLLEIQIKYDERLTPSQRKNLLEKYALRKISEETSKEDIKIKKKDIKDLKSNYERLLLLNEIFDDTSSNLNQEIKNGLYEDLLNENLNAKEINSI